MKFFLIPYIKLFLIISFCLNSSLFAQKVHTIRKLPTIECVSQGSNDFYVVFLTGDFGFNKFDKAIVHYLNVKKVSVVVLNTERYFWSKKNPSQLGHDLDAIVNRYSSKWGRNKVVFMGYSMGAEVLPFAINQLSEKSKTQVLDNILIAPSQKAIFRLKPTDYLFEEKKGTDIYSELLKMKPQRSYILCDDHVLSLCRKNLEGISDHDFLGGGHHFIHHFKLLTGLIGKRLNLE